MNNQSTTQVNWDERRNNIRRALALGYKPAYEFMHVHKAIMIKLEYLKALLDEGLIERDNYYIAGIRENAKKKRMEDNFDYREMEQFLKMAIKPKPEENLIRHTRSCGNVHQQFTE